MDRDRMPEFVPALGFGGLTPLYDLVMAVTMRERAFRAALIGQAAIDSGHDVLDLACGTGTLLAMIGPMFPGAGLVGLDADPHVLEIARRKSLESGVQARFDQGMSTRLPYADGSFDRVVSSLFFHHLAPRQKRETAAEILRVLRPGGQLHVADWGRAANPLMRALFVPVQLLDGFANTRENVDGRLASVFEEAGFTGIVATCNFATMFGTLSLYRAAKPADASS